MKVAVQIGSFFPIAASGLLVLLHIINFVCKLLIPLPTSLAAYTTEISTIA